MHQSFDLTVSTDATPEQLWDRFSVLSATRVEISRMAQRKSEQARNARSNGIFDVNDMLQGELEGLWRDYRVVSAHTEIMYALWTFMSEGCESSFLSPLQEFPTEGNHGHEIKR